MFWLIYGSNQFILFILRYVICGCSSKKSRIPSLVPSAAGWHRRWTDHCVDHLTEAHPPLNFLNGKNNPIQPVQTEKTQYHGGHGEQNCGLNKTQERRTLVLTQ